MQSPRTTTNVPEMLAVHGANIAYQFLGQWRLWDTSNMLILFQSYSSKYLQNTFGVGARIPKHIQKRPLQGPNILARYLEDFGKTGLIVQLQAAATGSKISWNQQKRHPSAGLCGPKCAHGALFHNHSCAPMSFNQKKSGTSRFQQLVLFL